MKYLPTKKKDKSPEKIKLPISSKKYSNMLLTWLCVATIAVITFFIFSPSLDNGFTNWDDNYYVTSNPLVINNSLSLKKIFENPVASNYHPLTVLSLALNYKSSKLNPLEYHFENVILHVLNTILVFLFIFLLTRRNLLMAAIVSLFFGIHPMHVESVSWVSERKDVLYVFFFLSGLITYLKYSETKKITWYFLTLILFIFSCLSKAMAVVFPVILLLIDYLEGIKLDKKLLLEKIPFFILSVSFGILAIKVQQPDNAFIAMKTDTVFQRLLFASYGAVMYVVKLVIPFKLSAYYPYPITNNDNSVPLVFYLMPFILLGIIAALIYFFRKKEKEIVFGLLFYFVSVVLVLQFISVGNAIMADRYSYLSYIGLLFIVAYVINKAWSRLSRDKNGIWALIKYPFMIIVIIGAVIFSYRAYSRTQVWKNSETLWTDVIDNYPSAVAYSELGNYYNYVMNDYGKALNEYKEAIRVDSTYEMAYNNIGLIYCNLNKYDSALYFYNRSIRIDPAFAHGYLNRGSVYLNFGNDSLALPDLNKAVQLDSSLTEAYNNLGIIYEKNGDSSGAMMNYNKAIQKDSMWGSPYINRGRFYIQHGRIKPAIVDFHKAAALDPSDALAYNRIGLAYAMAGENDSAIIYFNKAISLNPYMAAVYFNRGLSYKSLVQFEKAIDDFTTGIHLQPQNAERYYNERGLCYTSLKNYNEATADFSKAIEINSSVANYWVNRSFAERETGENEMAKADALKAQQLQGK